MTKKDSDRIIVEHVYKDFNVYYDKANSVKEKLLFWKRNRKETEDAARCAAALFLFYPCYMLSDAVYCMCDAYKSCCRISLSTKGAVRWAGGGLCLL